MQRDYGYYQAVFAAQRLPLAFVDLDLLAANMRQILARAQGRRIRLASKSIRCVALLEKILLANPGFAGILCFTAPEAVWLSQQGFDDLVVGYPCWHAADVRAMCGELAAGKTLVAMVDSLEHVAQLGSVAAACGVVLPVCLDIDLSLDLPGLRFGVWRSPIRSAAEALAVAAAIERSPHLRLDGVMGYEAQLAGVGDRMPGQAAKNALIRLLKRWSVRMVAQRRTAVIAALRAGGAELRFVNGGGTGSIETTIREPAVTEVTVGSGFFAPTLFDNYRAFRHLPAAGFAIEIVRRPQPQLYTCLGGGYVASGGVGPEKLPSPYLPAGAALLPLEGAGEVQTPIRYQGPVALELGDPIFLRHSKAGELCERFNTLALVSDGAVSSEVPTYRGQGQAFCDEECAMGNTWSNWSGSVTFQPAAIHYPASLEALTAAVRSARAQGLSVRVVGSGHSFTPLVATNGVLISLDRYSGLEQIDRAASTVTVRAGTSIKALGALLHAEGLAQENLGDIDAQTIAGAISTGTHGTGTRLGSISTQVVGLTLVTADGSLVRCSETDKPELLKAAQVALGALGIIASVTLRVVPAYRLKYVWQKETLGPALSSSPKAAAATATLNFTGSRTPRWSSPSA